LPSNHVLKRFVFLTLIVAGCRKPGNDRDAASADAAGRAGARAIPAAAFRLGDAGNGLAVYSLPTLDSTPWGAGGRVSGARSAIGVDMVGGRLLFRDTAGAIASFDLVSLRQRTIGTRRATATIGADGALLAVDSFGIVTESQPWGNRTWNDSLGRGIRAVFAAPGPRLLAVRRTRGGDSLEIVTRESGVTASAAVPQANDIAASHDGDALAFATDSGVVVYEDRDLSHPWFVRLVGAPDAVIFSPSGHRIYAALRDKSALAVIDRFNQDERGAISLPGPAGALRTDPWGRALLVRNREPGAAGETWVVGVADNGVTGILRGPWASDLPAVAQTGVLLSREGAAVVARDLRSLDSLGAVAGAASDVWFTGRWVPSSATARAAVANSRPPTADRRKPAPADSRQPTADSKAPVAAPVQSVSRQPSAVSPPAASPPPAVSREPSASFYAQVLATRNEEAARALAANLSAEKVQVIAPRQGVGDDNWRVVAGPFRSREAADSAGRSLGRPYWVVDRSRETSRP
jgi:cell division septation protein DedD